jgi:magnesium-transporting ATPase (P-type)
VARNHGKLEIENRISDDKEVYKLILEFPFDSTRKCMSVIVEDQVGDYYIFCKGADSSMMDKINFEKT